MAADQYSGYTYLDQLRINEGIGKCKTVFMDIYNRDKREAMDLLNDRRLTFACLFTLKAEIESLWLYGYLNSRCVTALGIIRQISELQSSEDIDYLSEEKDTVYPVLKWILNTGNAEDGMNGEYDQILDITVSVLLSVYQDKDVLPVAVDMVFKRNKKGRYIHNLVWAIYRTRDPYALQLFAKYIRSMDKNEASLACGLLNIGESNKNDTAADNQMLYGSYLQWLFENDPFLYFTGESFQFTSKPVFCRVDMERKYMQKGIASYDKQPIVLSGDDEYECFEAFLPLNSVEKTILSGYSHKVYSKDVLAWKSWMHLPIREQLFSAIANKEGVQ